MNKKIKIIELLNKIAKGEEVPENLYYFGRDYKHDKKSGKYIRKEGGLTTWFCVENFSSDFLNREVQILEDNTEEIEELDIPASKMIYDVEPLKDKINELVKAINKLRKEKE